MAARLDVACVWTHVHRVATVVFGSYEWDEDKAAGARLLCVVHVERAERDRIVSARVANASEEAIYSDR